MTRSRPNGVVWGAFYLSDVWQKWHSAQPMVYRARPYVLAVARSTFQYQQHSGNGHCHPEKD